MSAPTKQKIAILGTGVGSMAAAYALTSVPGWKDRYEITVYQQGHRAGGKGASGRNLDHDARIEEHGLHIWLGFYENAFRIMKECYAELGRNPGSPNATWKDAFKPHDFIVLEEKVGDGWRHWDFNFPRNGEEPGGNDFMPTGWDYLVMILQWMANFFEASPLSAKTFGSPNVIRAAVETLLGGPPSIEPVPPTQGGPSIVEQALSPLDIIKNVIADILGPASDKTADILGRSSGTMEAIAPNSAKIFLPVAHEIARTAPPEIRTHRSTHDNAILKFVDQFARWLWDELKAKIAEDDEARRLFISLDLGCAVVRGMIEDGIIFPPYDFRVIDDYDFQDWLRKHGASEITAQSAPVRALYDLCFAAGSGQSAGMTLYCTLRMLLTYKGAIFYKMQGGMGDVVFTPLYSVLRRRGVKFKFFHRVRKLGLTDDKKKVGYIDIGRQVTLKNGGEYLPLVDIKGLPSWPSHPLYDQIVEAEELKARNIDLEAYWTDWEDREQIRLELGKDFDLCVFGISVAAIPYLCEELLEASKPLRDMVTHTKTTRTQAMQLWMTPTLPQLGWKGPTPVVGAYAKPFDTWADMSFLLDKEDFKGPHKPGHIAYFCNLLDDGGPTPQNEKDTTWIQGQHERVEKAAVGWLKTSVRHLWPLATQRNDPQELNWDWLHDPQDRLGEERLAAQYLRANLNPSDRYVLSVPGSLRYRLRSHQSGFENLYLAGDWLLTSINGGCVEAATMGGLQAARAICGYPKVIVGDLDPALVDGGVRPALPPAPLVRRPALPAGPTILQGSLPEYLDRPGDLILRPPFEQAGTRLYAFFFRARGEALSDLCDRYLNNPAQGAVTYRPLAPFVVLLCANIEKIRSLDPRDANKGWMSEQDVGFWVPVLAGKMDGDRFVSERPGWFLPAMMVDRGLAVTTGREIFGFPKQQANIVIPRDPREFEEITVDTLTIARYRPDSETAMRRLLSVHHAPDSRRGPLERLWGSIERAGEDLRASLQTLFFDVDPASGVTLPAPALLGNLLRDALRERVRMIFLKQFRDAAAGDRACYQGIIETPATVRKLRDGGPLPGGFVMSLHPYESHPLAADLGLEVHEEGGLLNARAVAQFWADFDFVVEGGDEVWRAK
jgi:uncharacterized protein with NAD-binding domain and iron-sulfur cluster